MSTEEALGTVRWLGRLDITIMFFRKRAIPLIVLCIVLISSMVEQAFAESLILSPEERQWLEQHPTIEIGVNSAWPPMDYVDSSGVPQGIGVETIHLLNQMLEGRLKIVPASWNVIYSGVKERKMAALMDITPKESRTSHSLILRAPISRFPTISLLAKSTRQESACQI